MKKNDKITPSKNTKKKYRNNLFAFSFITAIITTVLVEFIYIMFFEVSGFGIESIYLVYIVPVLVVLIPIMINFGFKNDFDNFAKIEKALDKVANGDFTTRINTTRSGAFEESFNNFNKMVEELENNKILKEDFIQNFSHEFKTPIASIKGFADLLLEENLTQEEKIKYLKIISTESQRLTHLSENALLFSKINSEAIVSNKTIFNVGEQVKECVALLDGSITRKDLQIYAEIENCNIYSSQELLQEVWLNLLNNAIKFSNQQGKIEISVKQIDNSVIVSIKDYGIGMTNDEQNKIFNQYYQADSSHNKLGFGLGLPIAKRIVNLFNGDIFVESEKHKGSTFTVKLPLGFMINFNK